MPKGNESCLSGGLCTQQPIGKACCVLVKVSSSVFLFILWLYLITEVWKWMPVKYYFFQAACVSPENRGHIFPTETRVGVERNEQWNAADEIKRKCSEIHFLLIIIMIITTLTVIIIISLCPPLTSQLRLSLASLPTLMTSLFFLTECGWDL